MNNFPMALETLIDRAVTVGARMRSPDGVEQSVIDKLDEAKALVFSIVKELDDERARLLALLAPEPEAARSPHPLALTCPTCQGDGWVRALPEPEPSDAEIEAVVALMTEEGFFARVPFATDADEDAHYRSRAEWVLAAARAARRTGGAS